jgi:hypothetical protein
MRIDLFSVFVSHEFRLILADSPYPQAAQTLCLM